MGGGVLFNKRTLIKVITEPAAQKMKLSIKGFFSKCDQIRSFMQIRSHLLKKSLMENFIFCAVANAYVILFIFLITF